VLFGGAVFPIFAALYYWLPKMTGRLTNERLGKLSFWLIFVGFQVTFFPMHIMGLLGMPRRIYTYQSGLGWDVWNMISSIGSFVLAAGVLAFIIDYYLSLRRGLPAGDDPWAADTLEWAISSPPPAYNFESIPQVSSREPLWDQPDLPQQIRRGTAGPVLAEGHETVGTSVLDADSEEVLEMPGESPWPLTSAVGLLIIFCALLISHLLLAAAGLVVMSIGISGWLWDTGDVNSG
jgi:cytochrome c oxidase subunit 1/cytochrome c oxidase subunit I+III